MRLSREDLIDPRIVSQVGVEIQIRVSTVDEPRDIAAGDVQATEESWGIRSIRHVKQSDGAVEKAGSVTEAKINGVAAHAERVDTTRRGTKRQMAAPAAGEPHGVVANVRSIVSKTGQTIRGCTACPGEGHVRTIGTGIGEQHLTRVAITQDHWRLRTET